MLRGAVHQAPGAKPMGRSANRTAEATYDWTGVEQLQPGSLGAICGYFLLSLHHHLKVPQKPEKRYCFECVLDLPHAGIDAF